MCKSFSEIVIVLEGPQRGLSWGGVSTESSHTSFFAKFELMYCWIYLSYLNNILDNGRFLSEENNNINRMSQP